MSPAISPTKIGALLANACCALAMQPLSWIRFFRRAFISRCSQANWPRERSESLAAGDDGARRLRNYERRVYNAMKFYWEMVEKFYTTPFMEIFMAPARNSTWPQR
jgi:hypothetical protein